MEPGESLCGFETPLQAESVKSPGGQNDVCGQEDKNHVWVWRAFVSQMKARSYRILRSRSTEERGGEWGVAISVKVCGSFGGLALVYFVY